MKKIKEVIVVEGKDDTKRIQEQLMPIQSRQGDQRFQMKRWIRLKRLPKPGESLCLPSGFFRRKNPQNNFS